MALCICMSLFVGGVANAAMLCCVDAAPAEQEQMDNEQAMPCHEHADKNADPGVGCDGCDCQHCTKMSALVFQHTVGEAQKERIMPGVVQHIYAYQPEAAFQPPKSSS